MKCINCKFPINLESDAYLPIHIGSTLMRCSECKTYYHLEIILHEVLDQKGYLENISKIHKGGFPTPPSHPEPEH